MARYRLEADQMKQSATVNVESLLKDLKDIEKALEVVVRWDKAIGNSHHICCNFQPTESVLKQGGKHCNCGVVDCTLALPKIQAIIELLNNS